jgi:hypothetical protein
MMDMRVRMRVRRSTTPAGIPSPSPRTWNLASAHDLLHLARNPVASYRPPVPAICLSFWVSFLSFLFHPIRQFPLVGSVRI